jgi:hypothetical protein
MSGGVIRGIDEGSCWRQIFSLHQEQLFIRLMDELKVVTLAKKLKRQKKHINDYYKPNVNHLNDA